MKEFTAASMKMGTRMGIWILKDISHPSRPHDELCIWRNIQKEKVQSSLSKFWLSTEHGHNY